MEVKPKWLECKLNRLTSYELLVSTDQLRYPVNVFAIARLLNINVNLVKEPGYDGAITSDWKRAEIWLDSEKVSKQRFTLAHLLGHLMLHTIDETYRAIAVDSFYGMGDKRIKSDDGKYSANEIATAWLGRQASDFGSALLMPKCFIQPMMYYTKMTCAEIATAFDTSIVAVGGRLNFIRSGREDR